MIAGLGMQKIRWDVEGEGSVLLQNLVRCRASSPKAKKGQIQLSMALNIKQT